jgi:hypothetical protein
MIATGTEPAVLPIEGQVFRRGVEDALRQKVADVGAITRAPTASLET